VWFRTRDRRPVHLKIGRLASPSAIAEHRPACYGPVPFPATQTSTVQMERFTVTTTSPNGLGIHVRWMIRRDMAEVIAIEQEAFEFPWSEEDFTRCLRQRNCIGMVAELADSIVAFMIYELHRSRLHMLNFAVMRSHRRLGIGTQMLEKLIGKLTPDRRGRIALEVRETNLPAQLFFRSLGFRATSVMKDFYRDSTEDAYLMQYCLASAIDAPEQRRLAG
jgi:ribosomal-protein-alanine N-acetyltransferase